MNRKMKIAHSLDELEDQIILTIKDRPLLLNGQIDDDEDILQNDSIQISNEAKYNSELKSKLKNISDASSSHLEAKNQGAAGILPHYDDYSYKPDTIEVEEGGIINSKKAKKGKALGQDYLPSDVLTSKLNAEYSNKHEFKKSNHSKKSSKELLSFLDETAQDNKIEVKREYDAEDIIQQSLNQIKKKRILENEVRSIVSQTIRVDDQEESLLMKSIERSRKKAQKDKKQEKAFDILESIKEEQDENADKDKEQKMVEIELNPISYKLSDKVRSNDRKIDVKQAVSGTTSAMFVNLPSERLAKKAAPQQQNLPQNFNEFTKEQLDKMRDQVKFLEDKQVGTGLAGTLEFLRGQNLLGKEQQVGRYNDKQISYNDPNDRIKLQYRNASGKLMKPKEAYRYICAKFHGQGPSKNKVEMRKRRELQELRSKERQNEGGQLLGMLQKHQEQSGQAHLVLNMGKGKQ